MHDPCYPITSFGQSAFLHTVRRTSRLVLCGIFGVLVLCHSGPAQGNQPPQAPQGNQGGRAIQVQDGKVTISFDERDGVSLAELIKTCQQLTGKVFHIDWAADAPGSDPRQATQTSASDPNSISLIGKLTIDQTEFFSFFQTILFIKDWAVVPRGTESSGRFYDIIKKTGRRSAAIKKGVTFVPEEDLAEYRNQTGTYILTTVKLKYIDSQLAATTLRSNYVDTQGLDNLTSIAGSPSLMISGFGPSVYTMFQLLKRIDVKTDQPKAELRRIPLTHASVDVLEPMLNELLNSTRTAAPPSQAGRIIPPEEQIPVRILADVDNNALIVWAHKDKILQIENMVAQLDVKTEEGSSIYHIITLKNTLANEIRETLNSFVRDTNTQQQRAQQGRGAPGGAQARQDPAPVIIADEKSNQILISASKSQYDRLKDLIFKLDVRQPQVLIEMALIELGTQDVAKFGVELGLFDLGSGKRPFGLTSFGISTFQDTDDNGLADTRLPDLDNPLQGITGGIISDGDFAMPLLLNALKSNTTANVLSIPSIICNNNEEAKISSKEAFPTTRSQVGNVTTQQDFSGFQEAGIDLSISPSISEGNYVTLHITLEVSKFTGTFDSTSPVPPPKTTRKIETVVTMPTGHTMVIGGVIEDQSSHTSDGIPFLKDLPLIGILFRSTQTTLRKTNLYFFITPHILKEDDFSDLQELSFRKKLEAGRYIGHKRLRIVDRRWKGRDSYKLEDSKSTIEDLDRMGGFSIPTYKLPERSERKIDRGAKNGSGSPSPLSPAGKSPAENNESK